MTGSLLIAAVWTLRPTQGFVFRHSASSNRRDGISACRRLLASSSSSSSGSSSSSLGTQVENCVSRLGTLQTLLSRHGAPGSQGCSSPNDLVPLASAIPQDETPELLASLGDQQQKDDKQQARHKLSNLHPYLFPISQSKATGNLICAYRNPMTEESDKSHPWPIVESKIGAPGLQLLSLHSEHLMRRIVCEIDYADADDTDLVQLYNEGLGKGLLQAFDTPYEPGAVAQLGYGPDKYVLLRVGPFPDLYQDMARQHFAKGDEQSSLIAAEAANGKLPGFGSTFRFYARLLSSFPNREEETRDAARMCLRLPLPTIGMDRSDFEEVAVLGQMIEADQSSPETAMVKLKEMYERLKQAEEEDPHASGRTREQTVIEDASDLINETVLTGKEWSSIRPELAEMFRSIGREDMASFIDI